MKVPSNAIHSIFLSLLLAATATAGEVVTSEIVRIPEPESPFAFSISTAWDSRYVSEGRDNLDGDSLLSTTADATWSGLPFGEILVGTWYAWTPASTAYSEFNLYAEYGFVIGNFAAYVGYNHLRFYPDDAHDNEIGAGIGYGLPLNLTPAVDWVYSTESDGSYFKVSLTGEYEVAPWLVLSPAVIVGFNAGYVSDGHEGHNNVEVRLGAAIPIDDTVGIGGYVAYTWGVEGDPDRFGDDDVLGNYLYGGVSLNFSF